TVVAPEQLERLAERGLKRGVPVGDEQIEVAVAIDVGEGGRERVAGEDEAAGGGDVGEGAVALVVEETRLRTVDAEDEQVGPAVAVDVGGHRAAAAAAGDRDAGGGADFGERAVVLVVKEQVWADVAAHDVEIGPAVTVVVAARDAAGDVTALRDVGGDVAVLIGEAGG